VAGEYATTPATGQTGIVADAFVIVDYLSFLKFQAGQFDVPFTLENRTSDKYFDFMERSIPVRAFAVPANKDQGFMFWGWFPKDVAYYSLGWFNGDGQNFKNQDNWGALIGRGFVAPAAWMPKAKDWKWLADIWLGGSIWWQRNANLGAAQAPSTGAAQNDLPGMSTQGGFSFFSSNYGFGNDAAGNPLRAHLVPWSDTLKWAIEANVPIWKLGLRFEYIHVSEGLQQFVDGVVETPGNVPGLKRGASPAANRTAFMDGYGLYFEVWGWILGDNSFIERPGLELMPRMKRYSWAKDPKWGVMVAAKYELTNFNISGLPGTTNAMTGVTTADPAQGNYKVHTFELGVNAWGTKHVRLTVNYVMNYIDSDNAPTNLTKNIFYRRAEHELLARMGINL
jgi:hypothetical protein